MPNIAWLKGHSRLLWILALMTTGLLLGTAGQNLILVICCGIALPGRWKSAWIPANKKFRWVAGIMLLTEVKLDDSRAAENRGDLSTAAQDADDAITLQPWAAEPRLQLALVQERAGNLRAARRQIAEAIDRAPDDWALWFVASRIEGSIGDRRSSIEALHQSTELNPRAPLFNRGNPPQEAPGERAQAD